MSLLVEIFIQFLLRNGDGMVCPQLLKAIQTSGQSKTDETVLIIDAFHIRIMVSLQLIQFHVLSLLFEKPFMDFQKKSNKRT